jgi:hypothetical protein
LFTCGTPREEQLNELLRIVMPHFYCGAGALHEGLPQKALLGEGIRGRKSEGKVLLFSHLMRVERAARREQIKGIFNAICFLPVSACGGFYCHS